MLDILHYALSFIAIISVIVFIHEYGHYFFARRFGVYVEKFSIGFGPELWGRNDKHGTRWSISLFPIGGYVKMFGDDDPSSSPDLTKINNITENEKKKSLHHKSLIERSLIVFGGPLSNFILTIIVFTVFFMSYGTNHTTPIVSNVVDNSPAYQAGLKIDDKIISINGDNISSFEELRRHLALSVEKSVTLKVSRQDKIMDLIVFPELKDVTDALGNKITANFVGISSTGTKKIEYTLFSAFTHSITESIRMTSETFNVIGQMLSGSRGTKDLGGPLKIAQYSGQSSKQGIKMILWFIAVLSLNLGIINLLPIPTLDGGHLLFYLIEAIFGSAISFKMQKYGMKIGFVLIMALFAFSMFNDLRNLLL